MLPHCYLIICSSYHMYLPIFILWSYHPHHHPTIIISHHIITSSSSCLVTLSPVPDGVESTVAHHLIMSSSSCLITCARWCHLTIFSSYHIFPFYHHIFQSHHHILSFHNPIIIMSYHLITIVPDGVESAVARPSFERSFNSWARSRRRAELW